MAEGRQGATFAGVLQVLAVIWIDVIDQAILVRVVAKECAVDWRGSGLTAAVMLLLVALIRVVVVELAVQFGIVADIVAPAIAATSSVLTTTPAATPAALLDGHSAALSHTPSVVGGFRGQWWRQRPWWIRPRWAGIRPTRWRWAGMHASTRGRWIRRFVTAAGPLALAGLAMAEDIVVLLFQAPGFSFAAAILLLLAGLHPASKEGRKLGAFHRLQCCCGGASKDERPEKGGP